MEPGRNQACQLEQQKPASEEATAKLSAGPLVCY